MDLERKPITGYYQKPEEPLYVMLDVGEPFTNGLAFPKKEYDALIEAGHEIKLFDKEK